MPRQLFMQLALSALALASPFAHADYKDSYARGIKAYKDGNYAEARQFLIQARDEHPEPAARVRLYGTRIEPYVPQHYLGLIALQQGDCAGALAQWSSSGNQGVIAELSDLANDEKSAGAKCGSLAQTKPNSPPPPTPTKPVPAEQPPAPPPTVTEAQKSTVAAQTSPVAQAKPSEPPQTKSVAPIDKPVVADKTGPPDQLVQTFENFLSGRLVEVSRINPDTYTETRVRFHAYLIRCGALYTLAQVNGDQVMLEKARADARSAHALNASASPDSVLFSPRFLSFYAENR